MKRIESIDYLRGLMALSVVIYHYVAWTIEHQSPGQEMASGSLLSRLGIYAVSMFYIISGLSLSIAYNGRLGDAREAAGYGVKRVFRIFPLFWLVFTIGLLLGLAGAIVGGKSYSFPIYEAVLNYTLLFGFIDPSAYITVGAWSIGNEMVFYAIFAATMLASVRWPAAIPVVIGASIGMGVWFAYKGFDEGATLVTQWSTYINPFNQVILFFLGVAIGRYVGAIKTVVTSRWCWGVMLACALAVFCLYPIAGDRIALVTGHARMAMVASCVVVVAAIYVLDPEFRPAISSPLKFLGEASYSIYLMHPVVAWPIVFVGSRVGLEVWQSYCVAFIATLVVGWLTFNYLETPMMRAGKVVASRFSRPRTVAEPVAP